jgi:hypothetical protein
MRLWPVALALFAGTVTAGSPSLPAKVQDVLTVIDTVPTSSDLDTAFTTHASALQGLAAIARDSGATDAAGRNARLHAISALSTYCPSPCDPATNSAHQALVAIIQETGDKYAGYDAVVLRAAVEAIGPQRVASDLDLLVGELQSPSRDIRAAVAHSLRDLCNTNAIAPLRLQQQTETSEQVKQAITEALRVLGQAPCQ